MERRHARPGTPPREEPPDLKLFYVGLLFLSVLMPPLFFGLPFVTYPWNTTFPALMIFLQLVPPLMLFAAVQGQPVTEGWVSAAKKFAYFSPITYLLMSFTTGTVYEVTDRTLSQLRTVLVLGLFLSFFVVITMVNRGVVDEHHARTRHRWDGMALEGLAVYRDGRDQLLHALFTLTAWMQVVLFFYLPVSNLYSDVPPALLPQEVLGTPIWVRTPFYVLVGGLGFAMFVTDVDTRLVLGVSVLNFVSALLYMFEYPVFEAVLLFLAVVIHRRERGAPPGSPQVNWLVPSLLFLGMSLSSARVMEMAVQVTTPERAFFEVYDHFVMHPQLLVFESFAMFMYLKGSRFTVVLAVVLETSMYLFQETLLPTDVIAVLLKVLAVLLVLREYVEATSTAGGGTS